ncbi:MAG TPA: hypothetical protein VFT59_00360 [Candidatus Saccharimonadales bacterium]|nr:hypothetical protein [Candidatus Saccharimonadales bacterium]
MLRAHLGNEFGDPKSKEYKAREEAFKGYNSLIEKSPETVVQVMSQLALGETIDKNNRLLNLIQHTAEQVLNVTNNGTQIGIAPPAREAAWAEIFEDEGHKAATREYLVYRGHAGQSPEAIAACRKRGFEALKVVAQTNSHADSQHNHPTSPPIISAAA